MKTNLIQTIALIVLSIATVSGSFALDGSTILTEGAVRSADGFPFDNTSFDPQLLAVDGQTLYFASVNVTNTYPNTRILAFDINADETTTAATEIINDVSLKALFGSTGNFWFASAGGVAAGCLFVITAEDGDGDDGEYIEPADLDRVIRIDLATGTVDSVVAASHSDGVVALAVYDGMLYLAASTEYGAVESSILVVPATGSDAIPSTLIGHAAITAATGGSSPLLSCLDVTPDGALVIADNETRQVLRVDGLDSAPLVSVLVDSETMGSTTLQEVVVTGLAALPSGRVVVSDTLESSDEANDRGIVVFDSDGLFDDLVALESHITDIIPADDHLGFIPNNEIRVDADGRILICGTDNPESIFWLESPDRIFGDGFESGTTSAWAGNPDTSP